MPSREPRAGSDRTSSRSSSSADTMWSRSRAQRVWMWSAGTVSTRRSPGPRSSSTRPAGPRPTRSRRPILHLLGAERSASRRRVRRETNRPRLDHRDRQLPGRLQRREGGAGADAARRPASGPNRSRGPVPRVPRAADRMDDADGVAHVPEMRTQPVAVRWSPRPSPTPPRSRRSRTAGSRKSPARGRSGSPMWRLRSSPAEATRSRSARAGPVRWPSPATRTPTAYAEGGVLPNPGAKLAGPSFEEWLARPRVRP